MMPPKAFSAVLSFAVKKEKKRFHLCINIRAAGIRPSCSRLILELA
jgi:hypothetical protein